MNIKSEKDLLEQILFELIVLSAGVPTEDTKTSISIICFLSKLPCDVSSLLIEAGEQVLGTPEGYSIWNNLYAAALVQNNRTELAEALNEEAIKQLG